MRGIKKYITQPECWEKSLCESDTRAEALGMSKKVLTRERTMGKGKKSFVVVGTIFKDFSQWDKMKESQ